MEKQMTIKEFTSKTELRTEDKEKVKAPKIHKCCGKDPAFEFLHNGGDSAWDGYSCHDYVKFTCQVCKRTTGWIGTTDMAYGSKWSNQLKRCEAFKLLAESWNKLQAK